jgi:ABC-type branched-subunit amino acid transport system substrate-binding protein
MSREPLQTMPPIVRRRACLAMLLGAAAAWLAACTSSQIGELSQQPAPAAAQPETQPGTIGTGKVRIGLILPLSASGNAGLAAQSMKSAADMALAEFKNPDIQILLKDSGGTAQGAQSAAQQAVGEGAELILGPLFAQSVAAAGQIARSRGIPVIAFSTDTSVAARGVYLLSFLPESDVDRIVEYASAHRRRSIAAMIPDNAYGTVVEAALKQATARHGSRVVAIERYPADHRNIQAAVQRIAQSAGQADALFIPDGGDAVVAIVEALTAAGVNLRRLQLLGTGVWDADPRISGSAALQGGWFAAPDGTGFRGFAGRYRQRFGQDPIRTATLSYDAVALVAALVKTQGAQRFSEPVLTNNSGFSGIDGLFRFRSDGTNQRGLSVMRVTSTGGQVIGAAPKSFAPGR